jgi:hypothetical protein
MLTVFLQCTTSPDCFTLWSGIASFISLAIAVFFSSLYFFKPSIEVVAEYLNENSPQVKIKCKNTNWSKRPIFWVTCSVIISKDEKFEKVTTVELRKDKTMSIEKGKEYVFVSKELKGNVDELEKYHFMKVRISGRNFIGVEKVDKPLIYELIHKPNPRIIQTCKK